MKWKLKNKIIIIIFLLPVFISGKSFSQNDLTFTIGNTLCEVKSLYIYDGKKSAFIIEKKSDKDVSNLKFLLKEFLRIKEVVPPKEILEYEYDKVNYIVLFDEKPDKRLFVKSGNNINVPAQPLSEDKNIWQVNIPKLYFGLEKVREDFDEIDQPLYRKLNNINVSELKSFDYLIKELEAYNNYHVKNYSASLVNFKAAFSGGQKDDKFKKNYAKAFFKYMMEDYLLDNPDYAHIYLSYLSYSPEFTTGNLSDSINLICAKVCYFQLNKTEEFLQANSYYENISNHLQNISDTVKFKFEKLFLEARAAKRMAQIDVSKKESYYEKAKQNYLEIINSPNAGEFKFNAEKNLNNLND